MQELVRTASAATESVPIDHGGPVDRPFEPFPCSALERSIIDRFEAVARRFSTRVAVSDCARSLTYADFATLTDRIADASFATHAAAICASVRPRASSVIRWTKYSPASGGPGSQSFFE